MLKPPDDGYGDGAWREGTKAGTRGETRQGKDVDVGVFRALLVLLPEQLIPSI